MSGNRAETGATGVQEVVVTGQGVCGGVAYSGLGGVMDKGWVGDGCGGDGGRLIQWEDNVEKLVLGVGPNAPLAHVDSYIGALRKSNLHNHNIQNNISLRSLYDRTKDRPSSLRHSARTRSTA